MKIAIVDDLETDREALKKYLMPYLTSNNISAEVEEFDSGESFLEAFRPRKYGVVFFDIYMRGCTGISVAEKVFQQDQKCKIIFLTTSAEYFRKSYALHAVYYLIKPIIPQEFTLAMRFLELKPQYAVQYLNTFRNSLLYQIPTEDIYYIDVQDHVTVVHLENDTLGYFVPFREFTEPLDEDDRFIICMRGVLINFQHVAGMDDNAFILDNQTRVPISIRSKGKIQKAWKTFLFEHMEGN